MKKRTPNPEPLKEGTQTREKRETFRSLIFSAFALVPIISPVNFYPPRRTERYFLLIFLVDFLLTTYTTQSALKNALRCDGIAAFLLTDCWLLA